MSSELVVEYFGAADPEVATTIWSLGGNDAGDFSIVPQEGIPEEYLASLSFRNLPNYQMSADSD